MRPAVIQLVNSWLVILRVSLYDPAAFSGPIHSAPIFPGTVPCAGVAWAAVIFFCRPMRLLAGIGQEDSAMLMRYAAMRLMQLIPMVVVVTMVVFFVMMIVPGDPVMVMLGAVDGAQVSREVYDAMRVRLGLDQPLIVQYLNWLSNVLQGDLGTSITYRIPALEVIVQRLVPTIYLMVGGLIIAVIIAVPAGVLAAIHNSTKWDHLATGFVVA